MGRDERENLARRLREMANMPVLANGIYEETGCPKCGTKQIAVMFCQGKRALDPDPDKCQLYGEHLHVVCAGCKYGWAEHTKDYVPEPALVTE